MIEDLRFRMESDDIRPPPPSTTKLTVDDDILEEARTLQSLSPTPLIPADFEDYFSKRLETHYAESRAEHRTDVRESQKLCARLREANAGFVRSRRTDTAVEERERALQRLETGYLKFLEIAQNLEEGRKFYNELARMLGRWREEIRGFVYQRKREARDMEWYFPLKL
jgi:programmed cell death 6-interacting protein